MYTEVEIVNLVLSNNRAVDRAMVAIYNRQTESEKVTDSTREQNGVGFSGPDASIGSYYARWVLSGKSLSGKHLDKARKLAVKYRRQLVEIANSNHSETETNHT